MKKLATINKARKTRRELKSLGYSQFTKNEIIALKNLKF